jgi:hypothetical protein
MFFEPARSCSGWAGPGLGTGSCSPTHPQLGTALHSPDSTPALILWFSHLCRSVERKRRGAGLHRLSCCFCPRRGVKDSTNTRCISLLLALLTSLSSQMRLFWLKKEQVQFVTTLMGFFFPALANDCHDTGVLELKAVGCICSYK